MLDIWLFNNTLLRTFLHLLCLPLPAQCTTAIAAAVTADFQPSIMLGRSLQLSLLLRIFHTCSVSNPCQHSLPRLLLLLVVALQYCTKSALLFTSPAACAPSRYPLYPPRLCQQLPLLLMQMQVPSFVQALAAHLPNILCVSACHHSLPCQEQHIAPACSAAAGQRGLQQLVFVSSIGNT